MTTKQLAARLAVHFKTEAKVINGKVWMQIAGYYANLWRAAMTPEKMRDATSGTCMFRVFKGEAQVASQQVVGSNQRFVPISAIFGNIL